MYDGGIDGDFLKEVVEKGIKRIDIGAVVLPKPLVNPDVDEIEESEDEDNRGPASARITVPEDSSDDLSSFVRKEASRNPAKVGPPSIM
jgi:hypothetical protein